MIDIALSQHELRQIYQSTETDELVDRVRHKTLTPPAHQLILQELSSRGVPIDALPQTPASQDELNQRTTQPFLTRCWRGEEPLWKAFWVVGLMRAVAIAFAVALFGREHGPLILLLAYLLVGLPAEILWVVCVQRCGT